VVYRLVVSNYVGLNYLNMAVIRQYFVKSKHMNGVFRAVRVNAISLRNVGRISQEANKTHGGSLEFLHRSPACRKRRHKRN
jgi:hypothetical protein